MPATKRQSITVIHRAERPITWTGEDLVSKAFAERDAQALANALTQHPGCWQTELGLLDRNEDVKKTGTLAHFALRIGWVDALPVLLSGGDPLNHPDLDTQYSPLGTAIANKETKAFEWLLQKSLSEAPGALHPLEVLAAQSLNIDAPLAIAQKLMDAGYSPWHVNARGQEIPQICLRQGQIQLAALLAKQGHAQGCLFEDELVASWFVHLHEGEENHHQELLSALDKQGRAPSMSTLAQRYQELSDRDGLLTSQHHRQMERLEPLLLQRAQMGVEIQDARHASDLLRKTTEHLPAYWEPVLAILDQATLKEDTHPVNRNQPRPRI